MFKYEVHFFRVLLIDTQPNNHILSRNWPSFESNNHFFYQSTPEDMPCEPPIHTNQHLTRTPPLIALHPGPPNQTGPYSPPAVYEWGRVSHLLIYPRPRRDFSLKDWWQRRYLFYAVFFGAHLADTDIAVRWVEVLARNLTENQMKSLVFLIPSRLIRKGGAIRPGVGIQGGVYKWGVTRMGVVYVWGGVYCVFFCFLPSTCSQVKISHRASNIHQPPSPPKKWYTIWS